MKARKTGTVCDMDSAPRTIRGSRTLEAYLLGRWAGLGRNGEQGAKSAASLGLFTKSGERATISLAKVGSRAAMNFSFAFLRRAWRSGEF
uniref:(California timema) hypothetical protein n=1 Tax=Timema californicum TaxID=61474 RepID=A0A7R9JKJ0_TIMCA|nr:unnamed protein product [Timema californicum]